MENVGILVIRVKNYQHADWVLAPVHAVEGLI